MKLGQVFVSIFLCLAPMAAAAQDVAQIGAYQFAYPYPSPDGTRAVFQGNFDGRWQLYEITLETGAVRRLHVSRGDDRQPSWSPDGERIAFISNRDGNDEVYVLALGSGEAHSLAPHPGRDGHPKWSSNNEWIVFNRTFDPADSEGDRDAAIVAMRSDGSGELRVLSDSPNIETFPSFSPDAGSIAFVEWLPIANGGRSGDIVVVEIDSGRRRNLTRSEQFDAYPIWGASGEWIYFTTIAENDEALLRRVRPRDGVVQLLNPSAAFGEVRAVPDREERTILYNQSMPGQARVELFRAPIRPTG